MIFLLLAKILYVWRSNAVSEQMLLDLCVDEYLNLQDLFQKTLWCVWLFHSIK